MNKKYIIYIIILLLCSCTTRIKDIKDNPVYYSGRTVKVSGQITKIINIPLSHFSFIELKDKSSNIIVLTTRDYYLDQEVTLKTEVIAFDSSSSQNYSINIISAIEDFLNETGYGKGKNLDKVADNISETLVNILDVFEVAYLLIERE